MERSYVDVGKKSKGADVIDIYKLFILNFSIWKMLNHAKDFFSFILFFILYKYDFYLRDLVICNLKILSAFFKECFFFCFFTRKLVYLISKKHLTWRSQFQVLNNKGARKLQR